MNKTYSLDGVQAILSYPFKAPGWKIKFLIGAALFFANYIIPILPAIALLGYSARIMHDIIADNAEPSLPEWEDWGDFFSRGLKVFAATFVYLLPAILMLVTGYVIMIVPVFLVGLAGGDSNSGRLGGMVLVQ